MASLSNSVGHIIHYVYTWIPKTAKNAKEQKSRNCQRRTKHVNFAQSIKERNRLDYELPYTPALCILLHNYPSVADEQREISQNFSICDDLKVTGINFSSNEKKVSKRSASKKWFQRQKNVIHDQSVHFDKDEYSYDPKGRHSLCLEKVFGFSARFADTESQERLNTGLRGKRKLHRKIWSRQSHNKTNDTEQLNNAVEGLELIDLNESLSVISLCPLKNRLR
ncbi:uncharacterized protein LOC114969035 [Acropora millepora]|uniref:uncharacterized protein LOC114969035 n=1 Tax=Acropora millepora TaxID=45264 RepID=UPI001CF4CB2F|nr:uncharacterized protein LOC114969035 [Acropora millepora]